VRRLALARAIASILPLILASAFPALALSDEEIFRDFPFNLINPGARAISVGGAFISQADDSTAAQANPAGLMTLRRPELFVELRSSRYDSTSTAVDTTLDTLFFQGDLSAGAVSNPESAFKPTFISYVIPFERVALGFSRLESLDARTRTLNSFEIDGQEAIVEVDPVSGDRTIIGYQPVDFELTAEADLDARVVQWNVAFAAELHRRFFIGVTGVFGTADMNGRVDNLFRDRTAAPGDPFASTTLDYATRIDDSDTDIAFNAGLLWRPADWVSIGAVYRQGLRFVLDERIGSMGVRAAQAQELFGARFDNILHTPDSYGVGISFRPAEPWTLLVDAVRIEYSDLLDGYQGGLNRISFPAEDEEFTVDDGTEVHAGVERIFLAGTTPVALRFGAWSDPDHRIRAEESDGASLLAVYPAGERVTHYTAGFGLTLKEKIQLDFAADVSSVRSSFVFSTIYRF
jgi:hypothetical protein